LSDSRVDDNLSHGVRASRDTATMAVAGTTVARNTGAGFLQQTSATFLSKQDNVVHNNAGGDTSGTITPLTLH